jgi:ParB family chromosome partitioning protein
VETRKLNAIKVGPRARTSYDEEKLNALTSSILQTDGPVQPIIIDKDNNLLAGMRRYLAAKKAGLTEVPVHVKTKVTKLKAFYIELAENLFREDLTWQDASMGRAEFYQLCKKEDSAITMKAVSVALGCGASTLTEDLMIWKEAQKNDAILGEKGRLQALARIKGKPIEEKTDEDRVREYATKLDTFDRDLVVNILEEVLGLHFLGEVDDKPK